MKKIISILAFVALLAGCKDLYGPTPEPKDPVASKGVEVVVSDIQDSSFVAVITPKEEGVYFSYILRQEDSVSVLSADDVLACSAEGALACTVTTNDDAVVAGKPAKATFKAASAKLQFSGLKPNTKYVVYATAAGKTGLPCDVVSATATTSDALAPVLLDFQTSENQVALKFSEVVSCADSDAVYATVYCKNYLTGSPVMAKTEGTVVKIEGDQVLIKFSKITIPGSYYTVNFPKGTFVDATGNECAALVSKITSGFDEEGKFTYEGVVGNLKNGELEVKLPKLPEFIYLSGYADSTFVVGVPKGCTRIDLKKGYVTIVTHKEDNFTTVTEYAMEKVTHYVGGYYDFYVKFAGNPLPGDKVSIKIPAGAVMDWYGNVNSKDIVLGPIDVIAEPLKLTFEPESTSNRATVYVTTNDINKDTRWVCYTGVEELSDEEFIETVYEEIADCAEQDGISFTEELDEYFAYVGDDEVSAYNLSKGEEVEFAGFYISADGEALSDVFRKTVKTSETFTAPGSGDVVFFMNKTFAGMISQEASVMTTITKVEEGVYAVKSPWGAPKGEDLKIQLIDDSGNAIVLPTWTGYSVGGDKVMVEEIYKWNGSWSQLSFYDSMENGFILTTAYYDASNGKTWKGAYGSQSEAVIYVAGATEAQKSFATKSKAAAPVSEPTFTSYSSKFIVDKQARRNHLR